MPKKINPELRARALLPELPCGRPFGVLGLLVADEECQKFRRQAEDATAGTRLRPCGVGRGLVVSGSTRPVSATRAVAPVPVLGTEPAPAHSEDASMRSTSLHCNPSTSPWRRPSAGAIAHRVLFRCLLASFRMTHAGGQRPAARAIRTRRTTAPCPPVPGRWSRRSRSAADDRRSMSMRSTCRVTGR